ncbi:hypothetical protein [Ammoniphilus resinae]|uniref:Uncharacterized protein n=1 Tax=Ammoniphilus resinae TaxID=861532 RepID=A0ABS4GX91_9BACL|nr:hypothetical protein [Ammoniphilus resinae]MBP1934889.1 hypothetical protein [Ammoniphilus resinae]
MRKEQYPVLASFERNKEGMLSAWCPFCQCWHHHSAGEGHRIAHCTDNKSPFHDGGYVLKKVKLP